MPIKKQQFYEGAALRLLLGDGNPISIKYEAPFFILNNDLSIYLKYSTKVRSPWGFTFMPEEQEMLDEKSAKSGLLIGLICGGDGVASLPHEGYRSIAMSRTSSIHIACYRRHGEHYAVSGPDGSLQRKIAPSAWQHLSER